MFSTASTVAQNLKGFRGILCAPENISQNINTAKLRTGSQGGGSVMRSSSGWIVVEYRAGLWVVGAWCGGVVFEWFSILFKILK